MKTKVKALCAALWLLAAQPMPAFAIGLTEPDTSLNTPITASDFTSFFAKYKALCVAISGVCAITALIMFVVSITKLSASAGNDVKRSAAIKSLLISGVCLALFGGITTVVGVFWNTL